MSGRNLTGTSERAVEIGRGAGMPVHPIVDQRIAGSGVESEDFRPVPDPGHVRDAADVEDRQRLRQRRGEGGMEERSERRSLATRRDISRAEIRYDIYCEPLGQPRAVADLPGAAFGRAMQDRVPMEAD